MDRAKIDSLGAAAFSRSIRPLKRERRFRGQIVGFDTEYDSKTHELLAIQLWAGDSGTFIEIAPRERLTPLRLYHEACKLLQDNPPLILFVTYFSLAELQFLPVVTEGFDIREYANGSLDVTFKLKLGTAQVHIFDLARWFDRRSLDRAAESMGLEKMSFDTRNVTRRTIQTKPFRRYAIHDAYLCHEILKRLRLRFVDAAGIDPVIAKTPASASASAFRNLHVKKKLFCDNNRARYMSLRCAWGGHAEVFRRGKLKGVYHEWDLSSAYPESAIRLGAFPVQGSWSEFRTLRQAARMRGGICQIRFRFRDGDRYPMLPVHVNGQMLFPLSGESYCTLEEARFASECGARVQIVEGWGYRKGTRALPDYLKWTLAERRKATGASAVMFKLLGNALIGKFAQRLTKVPIEEYYAIAEKYGFLLDEVFELTSDELQALGAKKIVSVGSVFMPEWNALITGYTRVALAEMIRSGEAVYCHTDSVWSRKRPKCSRLPFGKKMSGNVSIIRTRFASIGEPEADKVKAGESHVAHHSIWTLDAACEMLRRFDGDTFKLEYPIRRPLKFREAVRTKRKPGLWVDEKRKGSTHWDHKRRLLKSGQTEPWKDAGEYLTAIGHGA